MNIRELMERAVDEFAPLDRLIREGCVATRITRILEADSRCVVCGERVPEGHHTCGGDCIVLG